MLSELMVYDAQVGKAVPIADALRYMTEGWLEDWSCLQTTLDLIEAVKQLEAYAAQTVAQERERVAEVLRGYIEYTKRLDDLSGEITARAIAQELGVEA